MNNDEIIIASIEELARNIEEIQKEIHFLSPQKELSFEPIISRFEGIEHSLSSIVRCVEHSYIKANQIDSQIKTLQNLSKTKIQNVVHQYIEIKNPMYWIFGFVFYILISIIVCGIIILYSNDIKAENEVLKANDLKYRFIKVYNAPISDLKQIANTTTDWIYYVDSFYKNKKVSMEKYVIEKEELINKSLEAEQIAKFKQNEAKDAFNLSKKLKYESKSFNLK